MQICQFLGQPEVNWDKTRGFDGGVCECDALHHVTHIWTCFLLHHLTLHSHPYMFCTSMRTQSDDTSLCKYVFKLENNFVYNPSLLQTALLS